jgi:hypothetical protein
MLAMDKDEAQPDEPELTDLGDGGQPGTDDEGVPDDAPPGYGARRRAGKVTGVRYLLEVRLTAADVGQRVVIRWRRPGPDGGEQVTDVLGILEEHRADSFTVRAADGQLVVIPSTRALAGKVVPARPRRRREGPASS